MSALAKLVLLWGGKVSGSDVAYSKNVEELLDWGAEIYIGESEKAVLSADLVVYSGAIKKDNPEFLIAINGGKKMISREYFLYEISCEFYKTIAISGTHGKTTVCAMLSKVLEENDSSFTAHVGGHTEKGNLIFKGKDIFLTEACEYNRSFLALRPDVGVILNIEMDHPDTYKNIDELRSAFLSFSYGIKRGGILVTNADSENYHIIKSTHKDMFTYAINNTADLMATNIINYGNGNYGFRIVQKGYPNCDIKLGVAGFHNVYNALATFACGVVLGIERRVIQRGIERFRGVRGRFEYLGNRQGACVYRDYAHHPTEIKASLRTARERANGGRLITLFQPHTLSRTEALFEDFTSAFEGVDKLYFLKEYVARKESGGKNAFDLYQAMRERGVEARYYATQLELVADVLADLQKGDLIYILGAGDIAEIGSLLLK